jgi:hypothetical protein
MRARGRIRVRNGREDDRDALSHGDRTAAHSRLLDLQAAVGNAAVSGLLQRQPTPQPGWSDADPAPDPAVGFSWNKARHDVGSMIRYPLQNLPEGNQGEWKSGASAQLSKEGAKGKAIVLVHKDLKPDKPVSVVVHLHGYTEDVTTRPFAGWRQHKRSHKVRDVEHDRIAQQIEAAGDPQIVGVLPQGGEKSQFGKDAAHPYDTFASDAYVKEVFTGLKRVGGIKAFPSQIRVVISAHSGGGHTVGSMLAAENERRTGAAPGRHSSAPSALGGVMLFDAMTWGELKTVKAWVLGELDKLLAVLTDPRSDRQKALDGAPRFRGYYSLGGSYVEKYENLDKAIRKWFADNHAALEALGSGWADKVWALFQVVPWGGGKGEGHETIVRGSALAVTQAGGNIADALKALKAPTARTARPVPPPPKPPPKKKSSASSRPRGRRRTQVP